DDFLSLQGETWWLHIIEHASVFAPCFVLFSAHFSELCVCVHRLIVWGISLQCGSGGLLRPDTHHASPYHLGPASRRRTRRPTKCKTSMKCHLFRVPPFRQHVRFDPKAERYRHNILEPITIDAPKFDSVGLSYLLLGAGLRGARRTRSTQRASFRIGVTILLA